MEMKWNKYNKENLPPVGIEVLAYNSKWVNAYFNPKGIRVGFLDGDNEFISAHWWDYQDSYITISKSICEDSPDFYSNLINNTEPEYWCEIPNFDILNEWKNLYDIEDIYDVSEIFCDTRDFHVMLCDEDITHDNIIDTSIKKKILKKQVNKDFLIGKNDIISWLKYIEKISSNNLSNIEWRYLSFDNIGNEDWTKFIRFYRYDDDNYVVTNNGYKLLPWREMTDANLNREKLCAQ